MGISITKNTLLSFKKKVSNCKNIADEYAEMLIQEAKRIANEQYGGIPELDLLYYEKIEDGVYRLVAEGKQLCYIEFGTGTAGAASGYPEDKRPTMLLRFNSRGREGLETHGWVYNYFKEIYAKNDSSVEDYEGEPAGFQMYNTVQELGREIGNLAKEYAKRRKQ